MAAYIVAWSRCATKILLHGLVAVGALLACASPAHADGWGCQVMLCLSDPRGPETEGACVPPIEKLWDALSHGHPFPSCDLMESWDSLSPEIRSAIPADVLQMLQSTTISGGNGGASGSYCPYDLMYYDSRIGPACRARSVIQVKVDGQVFTRVWWGITGGLFGGAKSQTEYFGAGSSTPFYDPTQSAQRWIDDFENNCNETNDSGCVASGNGSNH
jgi:hypothetical protein